MTQDHREKDSITFNTPFELGLRSLGILSEVYPENIDLKRLLIYDYLIIHSNDIKNGPPSLHPSTPHRSSGMIIRRKILQDGLNLMYSKSLLDIIYDKSGITYRASSLTKPFLGLVDSTYLGKLKFNAKWVVERFSDLEDEALDEYINSHLIDWGGEFEYEFLMEESEE